MKYNNLLTRLSLLFLAMQIFWAVPSIAQEKDVKTYFEPAVNLINARTIGFIHREAKRPNEAEKALACLTFECIYGTIPEDEMGSTGKLSKDIDAYKKKIKPNDDLGQEIDDVISFVGKKLRAKPRQQNVDAFIEELRKIRDESVQDFQQEQTGGSSTTTSTEETTAGDQTATETTTGADEGIAPVDTPSSPSTGSPAWLPWLALVVSLVSLLVSGYVIFRMRSAEENIQPSREDLSPENKPTGPLVSESASNYRLLEAKLNEEIRRLSENFERRIDEIRTQAVASAPSVAEQASTLSTSEEPAPSGLKEFEFTEEDLSPEQEEKQEAPEMESTEVPGFEEAAPVKEGTEEHVEHPDTGAPLVTGEMIGIEPETPSTPVTPAGLPEEEEGEMLPIYKYAGLADNDDFFLESKMQDHPDADSIFEIETYEDVPGRAFYSILNYPAVVERALQEPEKYLAPYCRFEGSTEGKRKIILVEEGILQKQGDDRWVIASKARIRFE